MKAQVVYEEETYYSEWSGPSGYTKVGVRIEDRVIWLAINYDRDTYENYKKWEGIAKQIAGALNAESEDEKQ